MYIRNLLRGLLATVPLAALLIAGLIALLAPVQKAYACLPCNCTFNPTLNCFGTYAAYTHGETIDTCRIEIAKVNAWGYDELAISLTSEELAALPEAPEQNMLVASYYDIALYKLTSGEFQINAGPDHESKVYVLNFRGCPAENVYESHFVTGQ